MVMVYTLCKTSENTQDTQQSFLDWAIISVDLKINGSQEFNSESMLMFITSKFKFNSFHSYVMLILKLITTETLPKLLFYKLMKKHSIPETTLLKLIHGMKSKSSTLTKLSKEPINTFFLNSLISDSTKLLLPIQPFTKMEDTSD